MFKKIVSTVIIWFIQTIDLEVTKDDSIVRVTVFFLDKAVITKTFPLTKVKS